MDNETETRMSIEEAANLLGVSTKSIQRYLLSGRLSKMKVRHRTFLLRSEVVAFAEDRKARRDKDKAESSHETATTDIVTVSRARYESLLIELGELRKEREYLLAAESRVHELERALKDAETELARARQFAGEKSSNSGGPGDRQSGPPHHSEAISEGRWPSNKPWWQK